MGLNIKFENRFEKLITVQQASNSTNFHEVFEENGVIRRKEEYKNNIIIKVNYYLRSNETEQQIISEILNNYSDLTDGFEIRTIENIGSYKKEVKKFFSTTGIYENFLITSLVNQEGLLVYEKQEDIINGVTHYDVRKYYYDQSSNDDYEFMYKSSGELSAMKGLYPPFVVENDHVIVYSEIEFYFPGFLSNNPYYQNANLLP